jgi:hypothetical protein
MALPCLQQGLRTCAFMCVNFIWLQCMLLAWMGSDAGMHIRWSIRMYHLCTSCTSESACLCWMCYSSCSLWMWEGLCCV